MATRGYIIGSVSQNTGYYRSVIYWERIAVSIENNTSTIRVWSFVDDSPAHLYNKDWNGTVSSYALTVDGQGISHGNFNSNSDSGWSNDPAPYTDILGPDCRAENIPVAWASYHDFTISHNADGTKTATVSHSYSLPSAGYGPGNVSISGSIVLDTIPRASQPTLSADPTALGNPVTIYTNRASSGFTHTIIYSFGAASDYIGTGVADSIAWTIPKALANQIPNSLSGVGTITCYTYSGETLVGTKTVQFTVTVPDTAEFRPSFTNITATELVSAVASIVGKYVQNLSNIRLTVNGMVGTYGSTIASCVINYNGSNYGVSTIDTGAINWSGSKSVYATITDSRGRTYSNSGAPLALTALPYFTPAISAFTVQRCNSAGVLAPLGTYVKIVRAGYAASLMNGTEKNTIRAILEYRDRAGVSPASWTTTGLENMQVSESSNIGTGGAVNNTPIVSATGLCDAAKSYDFQLRIIDKFYTTTSSQALSTGIVVMSWSDTGIGIGKFPTAGISLDVAGKINSVADAAGIKGFYVDDRMVSSLYLSVQLSSIGWKRVLEFSGGQFAGSSTYGCHVKMVVNRSYDIHSPESHTIEFNGAHYNGSFSIVNSIVNSRANVQLFSKVRYVVSPDGTKGWLEVYYNTNSSHGCTFFFHELDNAAATFSIVNATSTPETPTDGTAYVTSAIDFYLPKHYLWLQSSRDFTLGTVILTTLNYEVSQGAPWLLEVIGNTYQGLQPCTMKVQGYIYGGTMIATGGTIIGYGPSVVTAFCYNGVLCFYFPRLGYWQGFSAFCSDVSVYGYRINAVTAIWDSGIPSGYSKAIDIAITAH